MKTKLLFTFLISLAFLASTEGQTLNQAANWPNTNWDLDGTYNTAANVFTGNPTINTANGGTNVFSYNEDAAGSSSINNIAVQSPVIDLTSAFNIGERGISVTFPYFLNIFQNESLKVQYWDASTNLWVDWDNALSENNTGGGDVCDANPPSYTTPILNISSFSVVQLQGFRYRIDYDDNNSFGWGICISSPTITSLIIPACPSVEDLNVINVNTTNADLCWRAGSTETLWEIVLQPASNPTPSSGTETTITSRRFSNLTPNTNYTIYVRANCGADGFSLWESETFTTGNDIPGQPVSFTTNPINTTGGWDIALVDLNGDYLDDIVSVSSSNLNIHYQLETGGLKSENIATPQADFSPNWSLAAGDFDDNGFNDLLYGGGSGVTFMKANNTGTAYTQISTSDFVFSQRSNFVDIDTDGDLDAFVCHDIEANVYYINDGSGNLTFHQGQSPELPNGIGLTPGGGNYGTVWIDFDNDRDMDMFIAKCRGGSTTISTNELWRNDGNGVFINVADSNDWYDTNYPGVGHNNSSNLGDNVQTWSSAWADFDNDGDMDGFIGASNTSNGNTKLMRNNGDGTFTDITTGSGVIGANLGIENAPADFDNDGFVDILTNGDILFNNGDFTFTNYPSNVPPNGAIGDVNNDGFLDVFRSQNIYVNNTNSNNWIKINTIGTASNRNGIGARVEVYTDAGVQIRDVRSGEGFEFMSSLNTHFGIGSETNILYILIYWPNSGCEVFLNPNINETFTAIEGSGSSCDTLGVADNGINEGLTLVPNPANNNITISTKLELQNSIYNIYDLRGRRIMTNTLNNTKTIDVSKLTAGTYILSVISGETIKNQRFIKQ